MIWKSPLRSKVARVIDFITVLLGFVITYFVWEYFYELRILPVPQAPQLTSQILYQVLGTSLLYVYLLFVNKAYSRLSFSSIIEEFLIVSKVSIFAFLAILFFQFIFREPLLPRSIFMFAFAIILLLMFIQKTIIFLIVGAARKRGYSRRRVLVIGTGTRASKFVQTVYENFAWGIEIIGFLTGDENRIGQELFGVPIIDTYQNIAEVLKKINPEEVIITISTRRFDQIRELLECCEIMGVSVHLNSDFFGHITKNVKVDNILGLNLISFSMTHQPEWKLTIKRLIDIVGSLFALILLSPLLIVIAVTIYVQDGFPILYDWRIMGYNRRPIKSWKFRTMVRDADAIKKKLAEQNEMSGPVFKLTNDPRILPIGHFLRRFSFDELPQLYSVLKGDLSLVGPRPPLQYEFKDFELWHRRKLSVKPGLTCLWQISGRNEISDFDEWVKLDLKYIDNWTLLLDFLILFKTVKVVLTGKGAK